MTHYGGKELAGSFRTVRNNTIAIAEEIPEERYDFRPSPDTRSVRELLVHIAFIPRLQQQMQADRVTDLATVNFPQMVQGIQAEEAKPRTKAEILAVLATERDTYATYLEGLANDVLAERVATPGPQPATKSRLEMLLAPKEHEMHHRAQLMLIERMLGIVPHLTRQLQARFPSAAQAAPAAR